MRTFQELEIKNDEVFKYDGEIKKSFLPYSVK